MGEVTKYGDITPRTAGYAAAQLLERGQYLLVTERFGQAKPLPKKHTKTIIFRRYESLARATSPLAEGVPPTGQRLTYTDIQVTLQQYGDKVEITDVIMDTHEDPVLAETTELVGEQVAETTEILRIAVMRAGTNVFYANGVASRATVDSPPLRGDFRKICRFLSKMKGREISSIVKASAQISTEPVAPAFFALAHTDLDADFRTIDGFVPVEQYSNADRSLPGEVGKLERVRIILTPLFEPWLAAGVAGTTYLSNGLAPGSSLAADVYPIIVTAKNSYGIVPLQGEGAVKPMVVNPGTPTVGNELGQIGFVSWIMWQASLILNQTWLVRLEAAVTANPS